MFEPLYSVYTCQSSTKGHIIGKFTLLRLRRLSKSFMTNLDMVVDYFIQSQEAFQEESVIFLHC